MRKFRLAIAFVAASACLLSAMTVQASAAAGSATPSTAIMMDAGSTRGLTSSYTSFQSTFARQDAMGSATTRRRAAELVESGDVRVNLPAGSTFDLALISVYASSDTTIVRVPLTGGSLISPSYLAMFFDARGTLKNYVEAQFAPVDINEGKVTVFFDGNFKAMKYAHADGTVDDTLRSGNDFSAQSSWWSRFTDCLNSLGVASWVIGAVAATCAIFCVITAGTGCVACALGVAGAYTAELTFCAAKADQG